MDDDEQEDLLVRASSENEDCTDIEDSFDATRNIIHQESDQNSCSQKLKFVVVAFSLFFSSTALIIMLPLYMNSINRRSDAYTAMVFTSSSSTIILFVLALVTGKIVGNIKRMICPPFSFPVLIRTGLLYSLSCFLIVYAVDRKKVMCHLQDPIKGIVLVFSLVYYFFFCRKMMGLQKIFSSTTIIVGLFISVDYGLCDEFRCRGYEREHKSEDAGNWSWKAHSIWTFVYIFGLALWSLHYTLMEGQLVIHGGILYCGPGDSRLSTVSRLVSTRDTRHHSRPLLHIGEEDQTDHGQKITLVKTPAVAPGTASIALWIHVLTTLFVLTLCWTDMVPSIGKGLNAANFWNLTMSGLLCHFGQDDSGYDGTNSTKSEPHSCVQVMMFAWPFLVAYVAFTLSSIQFLILSESSVFTVAMTTAALPLSGIWWSLFRMTGLSHTSTAILDWSPTVTGELICSVLGLPIVLIGLALLCKAHFKEKSYGKLTITCFRRQPAGLA